MIFKYSRTTVFALQTHYAVLDPIRRHTIELIVESGAWLFLSEKFFFPLGLLWWTGVLFVSAGSYWTITHYVITVNIWSQHAICLFWSSELI